MQLYFTNIENDLISPETRARLVEIGLEHGKLPLALDSPEWDRPHWPAPTTVAFKALHAIPEIINLENTLKLKSGPINLRWMIPDTLFALDERKRTDERMRPGTLLTSEGRRHVDSSYRGCAIVIPLWPIGATYAGTVWWDVIDAPTPIANRGYNGGKAFLMNTGKIHAVERCDVERFNLQISFEANYNTVLQAMLSGNFRDK